MDTVKDRELVIPGKFLGNINGNEYSPYYFKEGGNLFSTTLGMARVRGREIKIIPSKGSYLPKEGDVIIAVVKDVHSNRWDLDINSPYECLMFERALLEERGRGRRNGHLPQKNKGEVSENFKVGDIISVKISRVDEVNFCEVIKPWKLEKGLIFEVNPKRVPRVIGKKRSMLSLIKNGTACQVIVGQNGRIWIKGSKDNLALKVIKKIIKEAQTEGLTNRIKEMLDKEKKNG